MPWSRRFCLCLLLLTCGLLQSFADSTPKVALQTNRSWNFPEDDVTFDNWSYSSLKPLQRTLQC